MLKSHEVLKLLKEGKSVREIAKILGAKTANVKAHKKRLIQKQLWQEKDSGLQWPLDLDWITDVLIDRLEKAKLVPELESKIKRLENQRAAIENELNVLRAEIKAKEDRARRYKLAVQQGDIK